MASDWRSADALRDRGLLMIDDDSAVGGGSEPAEPAKPRRPYSERPVARARRAKAQELIDRPAAEGRVRITDSDDEVAEWRRVVNYAKRHGLEPAGWYAPIQAVCTVWTTARSRSASGTWQKPWRQAGMTPMGSAAARPWSGD